MIRVLAINALPNGSTGNIMRNILIKARTEINAEVLSVFGAWHKGGKEEICIEFGNKIDSIISMFFSRVTGIHHVWAYYNTLCLLKIINKYNPNLIHLHNLHLWNINVPMLFNYIKKKKIRVIWTLHDCWSFTGKCPHFDMIGCDKWKTSCHHCPQYKNYPQSIVDNVFIMHKMKKKWFLGIEDMTIVTPSQWLAKLVKQSFLKEYPICVINNGIDLSVYKPISSRFKEKFGVSDKTIILGVAFGWGVKKGIDVFIELAKRLDESYKIVLVGTDENVDKLLPDNIISIHRTQNTKELAEIYSVADLFVNPTREETFPTVNMESLACGTPVLTFNTGGSPEIIDSTCGSVVPKNDIDMMEKEIKRICTTKCYSQESCLKKARGFDMNERFKEYVELYGKI